MTTNPRTPIILATVLALAATAAACGELSSDRESGAYDPYYGSPDTYGGSYSDSAPFDPTQPEPPANNQGDKYEDVGTNPFTMASHDPLSTFAADVDTASYQIFKRDLGYGLLPQPASVRLEEWVNYFSYRYEAPSQDSAVPFAITLEAAPTPFDAPSVLLSVGIKGKEVPAEEKRAANLVFLIDTSGSMSGSDRLPLVQRVLSETVGVLDPEDTVSIVVYASGTGVRLPPTPVRNSQTIIDAVNSLSAGGSTNGAGGIQLAYEQAESAFLEGGINHVILCTDGDFNVGTSSTEALVELIEEKRATGITLTVLGFGIGNLNDAMMEAISNAGNGVYGVIGSQDEAADYVRQRMLSSLVFIAKDMKIQVEFNPEHVLAYRLLGYENRAIADQDFTNDAVDAGEVGSGHTVTALYELILAGGEVPAVEGAPALVDGAAFDGVLKVGLSDLVEVRVRYKDVDAGEADAAFQVATSLPLEGIAAHVDEASSNLQWAIAVAAFAEILKQSPYAQHGDLDMIRALVNGNTLGDEVRVEFQGLFEQAVGLLQ